VGLLSEMSADEIRELERANKTVNDNSGPPEKTLMQKLGAGLKDRFTDPTFYAGLASAFNQAALFNDAGGRSSARTREPNGSFFAF
jgi:hypothetical protein